MSLFTEFLQELQAQSDAWGRARAVGQRISQLAASYREISDEQKQQLAGETEIELKAGADQTEVAKVLGMTDRQIRNIVAGKA
jgi:hypothetical protein